MEQSLQTQRFSLSDEKRKTIPPHQQACLGRLNYCYCLNKQRGAKNSFFIPVRTNNPVKMGITENRRILDNWFVKWEKMSAAKFTGVAAMRCVEATKNMLDYKVEQSLQTICSFMNGCDSRSTVIKLDGSGTITIWNFVSQPICKVSKKNIVQSVLLTLRTLPGIGGPYIGTTVEVVQYLTYQTTWNIRICQKETKHTLFWSVREKEFLYLVAKLRTRS